MISNNTAVQETEEAVFGFCGYELLFMRLYECFDTSCGCVAVVKVENSAVENLYGKMVRLL